MSFEFATVAVASILPDEDFRISFRPEGRELPGIGQFGIIQPLLLLPQEKQFRVISGFRRLQAARDHGISAIPALVCRALEGRQAVLLSLLERLSHGPLNDVERARCLQKFSQNGWSKSELARYLFPLMEIKFNEMVIEQLTSLLEVPQEIQERVARGEMYLYTAQRLAQWKPYELQIGKWFAALKLGVNKQRELLDLMDDVLRVCKVERYALVQDLEDMRSRQEPLRVYETWLQHLKCRRYPRLSAAQRQLEEIKARFHLPGQIQLSAPPFFEENRYKISFPFGSREELERSSRKLLEVAGMPELEQILKLI